MRSSFLFTPALAAIALATPLPTSESDLSSKTSIKTSVNVLVGVPVARKTSASLDASIDVNIDGDFEIPDVSPHNITVPWVDDLKDHEKRQAARAMRYMPAALNRHNLHRKNHGAVPLKWNNQLAVAAMASAKRCTFAHYMTENGIYGYGQNLAMGFTAPNIASAISDGWYSEVKLYTQNYGKEPDFGRNMELFSGWGHFTQIVWKDTTELGCATWRCPSVKKSATDNSLMPKEYGTDMTYCNYRTAGNFKGRFAANVGRPAQTQNIAPNFGVDTASIAKTYSQITGQKWT